MTRLLGCRLLPRLGMSLWHHLNGAFANYLRHYMLITATCLCREGAANEELIDFMSHVLGVKSRFISLDVGSKSRNKTLIVNVNNTAENVFHLLREYINK